MPTHIVQAFQRELEEELEIEGPLKEEVVGLVYDDETEVGRVHLGIVHRIELSTPKVITRDEAICDPVFMTFDEIRRQIDRFESWTKYIVDSNTSIFPMNQRAASA